MGSTGAVRWRAWICGFSSTAKTAAFAGPPTAPAAPPGIWHTPQQTASVSQATTQNLELGHKTTHVVTEKLRTGSLGTRPRRPGRPGAIRVPAPTMAALTISGAA